MDLATRKVRIENRNITLLLAVPVAIVAKLIQFFVLPDKYFYDSWRMLSMMSGGGMIGWSGYQTTVDFYEVINIFDLTSLEQWSIFMGMIMTPIAIWIISKTEQMTIRESIFALMAIGLLNIYVFGITKEAIQISFFFLIYIIINLPIQSRFIKILGCAAVFYWESTFYRSYYIIMAAMTVVIYFVFYKLRNKKGDISKWNVFGTIIFSFGMIFLFLYVSSFVRPEDF